MAIGETSRRELLTWLLGAPLATHACRAQTKISADTIPGSEAFRDQERGHRAFHSRPRVATEFVKTKVAIVGGGVAGLAAAWRFRLAGMHDYRLLDLGAKVGGNARSGSGKFSAFPWGAHYVTVPSPSNRAMVKLLDEVGAVAGVDSRGQSTYAEHMLCRDPEERVFFRGRWYEGLYLNVGASAEDTRQRKAFERAMEGWSAPKSAAFTLPTSRAISSEESEALDSISAEAWMDRHGFTSPRLRWWVDYACRDDFGSHPKDVSAWALVHYFSSRKRAGHYAEVLTWPEGNARLVRQLARGSDERIVNKTAVFDVNDTAASSKAILLSAQGDQGITGFAASHVIMGTPQFVTTRVVRSLRDRGAHPNLEYSPWLVANITLKERPGYLGFETAWDNVLYDSPSLGYVVATHQRGADRGPTVWTYYYPLAESDVAAERQRLSSISRAEWVEVILSDLERAHPDLRMHVAQIDIARYGHAMLRPRPGLRNDLQDLQRRRGRVHFAHSDLSGLPLFEEALDQGIRAAETVLSDLGESVASLR